MTKKARNILFIIMLSCAAAWTAFIFFNSSLPADVSTASSRSVLRFAESFFSWLHIPNFISEVFIRKSGHFLEFTLLGLLLGVVTSTVTTSKWGRIFAPFSVGALVAMADETIQLFVPGRSSEVVDVMIDCGGVTVGIAFSFLTVFIIMSIIKRSQAKKAHQA